MISFINKAECTGCGGCVNICPVNCIHMEFDLEGFRYPNIKKEKCIHCQKCEKICPVMHRITTYNGEKAYAAINKDDTVRTKSSSGGIFSVLAETVLNKNGVVFGACLDSKQLVYHEAIDNINDLYKLRGSKYVQSDIGNSYKLVKQYLKSDRIVLFTGTPCQIAGLRKYLEKDYNNLICQDIICHGVPSPIVFEKYLNYLEKKGGKIKDVQFRDKSTGWKKYSVLYSFENGKEYKCLASQDTYMRGFLRNYLLRPSCYKCQFKGKERYGDITLADLWGVDKILPDLDDDKGISLVLLNSYKAETLWKEIENQDKIYCYNINRDESLSENKAAIISTPINKKRKVFFNVMKEKGAMVALNRYCRFKMHNHALVLLKVGLKRFLKS